jgi:hypothetical protein
MFEIPPKASPMFLKLQVNSWESVRLIGIYLRSFETLGFGLGVMVAARKQFEQSASRLGRHVRTPIGHRFRPPCGLARAQTNSKKVGKGPRSQNNAITKYPKVVNYSIERDNCK